MVSWKIRQQGSGYDYAQSVIQRKKARSKSYLYQAQSLGDLNLKQLNDSLKKLQGRSLTKDLTETSLFSAVLHSNMKTIDANLADRFVRQFKKKLSTLRKKGTNYANFRAAKRSLNSLIKKQAFSRSVAKELRLHALGKAQLDDDRTVLSEQGSGLGSKLDSKLLERINGNQKLSQLEHSEFKNNMKSLLKLSSPTEVVTDLPPESSEDVYVDDYDTSPGLPDSPVTDLPTEPKF